MYDAKTETIDGIFFKVIPFPALEALRLKAHILKIAGPAFGQLLGSFENLTMGSIASSKINGDKLGAAIDMLMSNLSENEFTSLIERMLKSTSCKIKGADGSDLWVNMSEEFSTKMDLVFQGKLMSIYAVLFFILKVNFPDFFGKVGGIGSRIQTALSKPDDMSAKVSPTE